jgi:hypothetical protein
MNITSERQDPDLIKGVAAGLAGGLLASFLLASFLLASFLMEQFQALWSGIAAQITNKANKTSSAGEQPATVKAANAILLRTQGRPLSKTNEPIAGEAVHYAVGAASGGIYGGLAEMIPTLEVGEGLGFGAGLWLIADEVTVPALKLSKPPTAFPISFTGGSRSRCGALFAERFE